MALSDRDLNHIVEETAGLFQAIAGSRVFVTGGTGFFGKWLLESFAWANEQLNLNAKMLVLSRGPDSFKAKYPHLAQIPCIEFCQGDVRDFDFPQEQFDFIIHAATEASSHMNRDNPILILDTIVEGTRRVLDFAVQCGAKRFLLTSTGAVYGQQPPDVQKVAEDYTGAPDLTKPTSAYGQAKRVAELLCSIYQNQHGLEVVIARCFAFVGPYLNLDIHYAIGNFIRDGLEDKAISVLGDGTPYRSYLYAADLTIWLWTILFKGQPSRAYNVGSDKEISIAQLAKMVSNCFPKKPQVKIAQKPVPGLVPQRYVPSVDRAKEELGLQCWIDLDEAIKRTIQFCSGKHE